MEEVATANKTGYALAKTFGQTKITELYNGHLENLLLFHVIGMRLREPAH